MKYVNGEIIKIGDVVWYCSRTTICRIAAIIEDQKSIDHWSLDKKGVFLCDDPLATRMECNIFVSEDIFKYDDIAVVSDVDWKKYLIDR